MIWRSGKSSTRRWIFRRLTTRIGGFPGKWLTLHCFPDSDGIKIIQVDGLNGAAASGGDSVTAQSNLADQLVNSALRYRGQAPLVDALLSDIGLNGKDLNGITQVLHGNGDRPEASTAVDVKES